MTDVTTAAKDPYPSRLESKPSIVPRRDPVVYSKAGTPLAAEVIDRYVRDGYLFFRDFLDAQTIAALNAELERFARDADPSDEAVIREPDSDVLRSVFEVHRRSAICDRVLRHPRVLGIVEQILGSRAYVHQSRINYKSGFDGKEFYWHSDFETWHVEDGMPRMRAVSLSFALSDNTPTNGPLMLVPGAHKHYVSCVGGTPEDHFKTSLRRQEFGVPDPRSLAWLVEEAGGIVSPVGAAGSLILFDCNAMHGSNGNITPYPRSNLFVVYNSVENKLDAPFGGTKPRPEFIANRDFRPLAPA